MSVAAQDLYRDEFLRVRSCLPGRRVPWLQVMRKEALECFLAKGFPTTRQEDWKYTSVKTLQRRRFRIPAGQSGVSAVQIQRYLPDAFPTCKLVFVDGLWMPGLSATDIPRGVTLASLAGMLDGEPDRLRPAFGQLVDTATAGFPALTTSLMRDGAYIRVSKNVVCDRPIHLVFVATGQDGALIPVRNLVIAAGGSRVTLIESHVSRTRSEYLSAGISEILAGEGAELTHYRIVDDSDAAFHVWETAVNLERDSHYAAYALSTGARLLRSDLSVILSAAGAGCTLGGLSLSAGRQHMDNHLRVEHRHPDGTSRQYYKSVLKDRARTVFDGRVVVHRDAQKTDARQSNHSLLLSGDAEADAKPQLEIYADDVRCTHGCTVGQLDEDALFYLRSRGVSERDAQDMLIRAFAADVLDQFPHEPVRRMAGVKLEGYLR